MFNCNRHCYRNHCHVPHPEAQLPSWNQQPIGVAHWWHPYRHAHSALCYHGYWFPQTLSTGSAFLPTFFSFLFHQVYAYIGDRAYTPY
jgi:hypothetical protein